MSSRFPRSVLRPDELENILDQWQESEDGLDFSDDDDVADPSYVLKLNDQNLRQDLDEEPEVPFPEDQENYILLPNSEINTSTTVHPCETPPAVPVPSSSSEINTTSRSTRVPKTNIIWKTKNLELNEDQMRFWGSSKLPD